MFPYIVCISLLTDTRVDVILLECDNQQGNYWKVGGTGWFLEGVPVPAAHARLALLRANSIVIARLHGSTAARTDA